MMRKMGAIPILLLIMAMAAPAWAFFEMSFQADRDEITIGGEVAVTIEILHGGEFRIKPLDEKIKLEPFEVKRVERIPPVKTRQGVREGYRVVLTIFELGEFKIPPLTMYFETSEGKEAKVQTEEMSVNVVSVGRAESDTDDIRPIKSPYSLVGVRSWKSFFLVCLAVLIASGVIYGIVRYVMSKRKYVDPESLLKPHERALRRLDNLPEKKYLETGKPKQYFTELSFILERYLIEQFDVISEDLTTEEILERVENGRFDSTVQLSLRRVLNLSDLAKFAKWTPDTSESREARVTARQIIEDTMPREEAAVGK